MPIPVPRKRGSEALLGRPRWMPGGRAIAFLGQDVSALERLFGMVTLEGIPGIGLPAR